jgi:DNA-directed RNA polymerase subunit alpha
MIDPNIILPSKPKIVSEDAIRGVYEVEGLHPGYGYTLGNSLRRIILSSLVGVAITSLKVEGATHEFSTLPGVKEDLIMIILNLKKVRFNIVGDEPQKISLDIKGAHDVKAGDIKLGGQVEILNKDQHLATLTEKNANLSIEMTIEKGLGYVTKETLQKEAPDEIGRIFLDAAFTPISRVSYEVENMRVGDRTDYNRLRISIETDGTLTPHEALTKSIEIMIAQLKAIVGFKEEEVEEIKESKSEKKLTAKDEEMTAEQGDALKTRIEDLELSPRTAKALTNEGIRTVGGLARKHEEDLLEISGLGEKGINEIKKALSNFGITLK